jgi:hypothetical protein
MRKSSLAVAASLLIVVSSANAAPPTNLVGMTATSYTMSGSSTGRSLSFQSTSNGSFNPSFVNGATIGGTGDQVAQTGSDSWTLGAFAYDISPVVGYPFPTNIVGVEANTTGGAFSGSSVISCTYTLVFSGNQQFLGLNDPSDFPGGITATLTSGGTTTDLTDSNITGTVFSAGTYTLALQGNGYSSTTATLIAIFAGQTSAVPGTGIAALLGATIVSRRRRR